MCHEHIYANFAYLVYCINRVLNTDLMNDLCNMCIMHHKRVAHWNNANEGG